MNRKRQYRRFRGCILYDDACGLCSVWIGFWKRPLQRQGFKIAPLQSAWVNPIFDLPYDQLVHDLRLILWDGRRLQGADVYRYVMKHVWWAAPMYLLSTLPGTRSIFNAAYRAFADNRFRMSRACGLSKARSDARLR